MKFNALILSLSYLTTMLSSVASHDFPDWLTTRFDVPTTMKKFMPNTLRLSNGIISREFTTYPGWATIDFYSHEKESSVLRALEPEAVIQLDGTTYKVGGVSADIPRAYLNRTALAENITADPTAFQFSTFSTRSPEAPFYYVSKRGAPKDIVWPPKGLRLDVEFIPPATAPIQHQNVRVIVHYEVYDGIPLLSKWLSIYQPPPGAVRVSVPNVEQLSVNFKWQEPWIHVTTDQAHGTDVTWHSDVKCNMPGAFTPTVNCTYSLQPNVPVSDGFVSFRVHELVVGSDDPERIAMAEHRKMRLLAPHTQENPIFFHMVNSSSEAIHALLDQMAEVGFEMLIYSFGSGFDVESDNATYLNEIREVVSYANSKGIEVGGYDLICWTRKVRKEWLQETKDNKTTGNACFASGWYDYLMERMLNFMDVTGLSNVETDGPYPGYECASTNHSHHEGYQDSVYWQMKLQEKMYLELRNRGVYINQPDNYFYQGGSKTGLGYVETQYNLPRWQDLSVTRQDITKDTYRLIPTAGWVFLPLVEYHGGGNAATFEPISDHKLEYEWGLAQYLGAGIAACYRGYRLYDSPATKAIVKKWVDFYKKYRDILISDIIHVRAPDMQTIDSYMHVNPYLDIKALAMVFNPTEMEINHNLTLPLYYTGLDTTAQVSEQGGPSVMYRLDRGYNIHMPVRIGSLTITWFLIQ